MGILENSHNLNSFSYSKFFKPRSVLKDFPDCGKRYERNATGKVQYLQRMQFDDGCCFPPFKISSYSLICIETGVKNPSMESVCGTARELHGMLQLPTAINSNFLLTLILSKTTFHGVCSGYQTLCTPVETLSTSPSTFPAGWQISVSTCPHT